MSNEAMKVLLEYNAQDIPSGESRVSSTVHKSFVGPHCVRPICNKH